MKRTQCPNRHITMSADCFTSGSYVKKTLHRTKRQNEHIEKKVNVELKFMFINNLSNTCIKTNNK